MKVDPTILVAIISAAAAIVVPTISYNLTKRKEREAEWRKYRFEQYSDFIGALSGSVGATATPEARRSLAEACNRIQLSASNDVIAALHQFQDRISPSNPDRSMEQHDQLLSQLFQAIRVDLKIPETPRKSQFKARVWSASPKLP